MLDKLSAMEDRYHAIGEEMTRPSVLGDYTKLQELGRERAGLERVVSLSARYRQVLREIDDARTLLADDADDELRELAREDLTALETERTALEADIQVALLPADPDDDRNVIVEVRAGTGGEEAALF
ncbi:MAG: PCRF domain-containing protein, partial [Chloroflexota bacterium]|nr:PCRF domain-containing protein [Chloroflexota bacterium]